MHIPASRGAPRAAVLDGLQFRVGRLGSRGTSVPTPQPGWAPLAPLVQPLHSSPKGMSGMDSHQRWGSSAHSALAPSTRATRTLPHSWGAEHAPTPHET